MITISAFKWVPPFAQGTVRDLRTRWALEEAGIPYQAQLIDAEVQAHPDYRSQQPFGQVPIYTEDDLVMFESGAIVLHIAQKSQNLLPADPQARERAITWVFAALNSVEIVMQPLAEIDFFYPEETWAKLRRPLVVEQMQSRLAELSSWLGEKEYLEETFTAGDLMMTTVLRISRHTDLLDAFPNLKAYRKRCEARPAFQQALQAQMTAFKNHEPPKQA